MSGKPQARVTLDLSTDETRRLLGLLTLARDVGAGVREDHQDEDESAIDRLWTRVRNALRDAEGPGEIGSEHDVLLERVRRKARLAQPKMRLRLNFIDGEKARAGVASLSDMTSEQLAVLEAKCETLIRAHERPPSERAMT